MNVRPWLLAAALLGSCGGPRGLDAGPNQSVRACDFAIIEPSGPTPTWSTDALVYLDTTDDGAVVVRGPVSHSPTEITLTARVGSQTDTMTLMVAAAPELPGGIPGHALDCPPFSYGVASGDPTPDGVVLWTRVDPSGPEAEVPISWEMATDPALEDVVATGRALARPEADHTVRIEVDGLSPGTTYYYRFVDGNQVYSTLGRTRTAPEGPTDRFTFATLSCSSLWSGWFNAYARLAERDELDLIVHLGDYVYDFVDEEEEVRMPIGEVPNIGDDLDDWRQRHRDYLADPDLRRARAAHPWFVIWDNHDSSGSAPAEVARAFREYVPMRQTTEDPAIAYRSLRWGDLAHLLLTDQNLHRDDDTNDKLGADQWKWLADELDASADAHWRVLGFQKLVSELVIPLGVDFGGVSGFDPPWTDRRRLVDALRAHDDNLVLSGDLHFAMALDLVDPDDGEAVGVELLAAGITRGNFDETLCGGLCDPETEAFIQESLRGLLEDANPRAAYFDLVRHGYGIVRLSPDEARAELWFSRIRQPQTLEELGAELVSERGSNRWRR
jgi:alkaline phosphatase D